MNLGLDGRAFVVGGGSRGIGYAIAQALVEEGANVLLVARDAAAVDAAAAGLGPQASGVAADISEPGGAEAILAAVEQRFGGLDGIVVNHGGPPGGKALDLTDEQWLQSFQLVVGGPVRLLRTLRPALREGSSILFVTSSSVRQPIANLDSSNVLRPGIPALAKVLAQELGPAVRVNTVAPGRIDTERLRSLEQARSAAAGTTPEDVRAQTVASIPLGRIGDPAEFGRVAAFLLSPAASYVSGAAFQVDGGLVTAIP